MEVLGKTKIKISDYLNSRGYFLDKKEIEDPLDSPYDYFTFSKGDSRLGVSFIYDLHDQYFCYHISFNNDKLVGVFSKSTDSDTVDSIIEEVKKKIV